MSDFPNWLDLASEPQPQEPLIDPRRRLACCMWLFALGALTVLARAVSLEVTQGDAFRAAAAMPIVRRHSLEGARGRILARDGTVLAIDLERPALAVQYRQLQEPPDPRWLCRQARASLKPAQRKDATLLRAAESQVIQRRRELHQRLAALCRIAPEEWQRRAARIQQRVTHVARVVNDRRDADQAAQQSQRRRGWFLDLLASDEGPAAPIVVAEELDYHVIVEDVPLEVVAEVEGHPELYPGVRIEPRRRRHYPHGSLAAHLIGHLGPAEPKAAGRHPDDRIGCLGLEMQHDALLYGARGTLVEHVHRTGEVVVSQREQAPGVGHDLTITLDLSLQRTAESLLDSACQRRDALAETPHAAGGGVVVMDVQSGAVLAAASAPRFDPNVFAAAGQTQAEGQIARLLADAAHPLFDRVTRMALAPGSLFKPITAAALLEASHIDPDQPVPCQGYWRQPQALRCAIYARHGIGHGEVNLRDSLIVSCNVYFFRAAGALGPQPLCEWAARFGLGRPTGIDLPGEAAGFVPQPAAGTWTLADTQALAIGQSRLTVTPLQMARVMAALANGGSLVTPHLLNSISPSASDNDHDPLASQPPQAIPGLSSQTLDVLRESLARVVSDPTGTAHETVFLSELAIAGKTGTAQAGAGRPDHAWFAAYCPADAPKVAIVVALEHAGDGGAAAGPVARRLIERMRELGYFQRALRSAESKRR